jgi:hypothetical protein
MFEGCIQDFDGETWGKATTWRDCPVRANYFSRRSCLRDDGNGLHRSSFGPSVHRSSLCSQVHASLALTQPHIWHQTGLLYPHWPRRRRILDVASEGRVRRTEFETLG